MSAGCSRHSNGRSRGRGRCANAAAAIAVGDAVRMLPAVGVDDEGVGGVVAGVADDGGGGGTDELSLWWLWLW